MASRALIRTLRNSNSLISSVCNSISPLCQVPIQRRFLLIPSQQPEQRTLGEVVKALSGIIGGPSTYDPDLYNKMREELVDILPNSQSELPARRMLDSFDSAIIPLGSDYSLRDRYLTHHGGVRIGRLLEDMDIFAVHLGKVPSSHYYIMTPHILFSV